MKRLTSSLLVLLGAASFGILSTVVKLSYQAGFNAAEVTGSQVLFGCICLWLISIPSWPHLFHLPVRTIFTLLASGLFTGLVGIFYYYALQTIAASFGIILLFQFVWMGFLVEWLISRKRPTRKQWIAIGIVLVGTFLAAGYQALNFQHLSIIGILLGLLAAASYTGNLTVNGRVATEVPSALRSALMLTGATIITLIVYPPQFLLNSSLGHGLWLYTVILGLFGVIIPPYLYAIGIPKIGSAMASILGSIELPIVILCSSLILHEQVAFSQICGVVLILLGIIISELRLNSNSKARIAEPDMVAAGKTQQTQRQDTDYARF